MSTEMRARLGINNCFAVKRWPEPADWAPIVADLGLDTVELLILEVIPAFEADDRQVVDGLRASVQVWARALSDRGLR